MVSKKENQTKRNEVAELAAKKFIQHKSEEIGTFFAYLFLGILIPVACGMLFWTFASVKTFNELVDLNFFLGAFCFWVYGVVIIGVGFWLWLLFCLIYSGFKKWITNNFKKALEEAEKEVNSLKK